VPPCRQLKAVANAAAQLDAKLCPAAAAGSLSARSQLWAASKFIRGAAILAEHLSLAEDVVAQVCKAAAVLFGSGGLLLQSAASKPAELSKWAAAGVYASASATNEASGQMEAVQQLLHCLKAYPTAAAEFAASTARPDQLLGWLSSVVELLLVSEDQPSGKGFGPHAQQTPACNNKLKQTASLAAVTTDWWAYRVCGTLLAPLLERAYFEEHRRSLTANAALQQRCAAVLLLCFHAAGRGLARAPPQDAWGKPCRTDDFFLEGLSNCFQGSTCLHGAIKHQLSTDPMAVLRSAMDIFEQLDLPDSLAAPALSSGSVAAAGGSHSHRVTVAPQCHVIIASIMSVALAYMQQRMAQPSADVLAALPQLARRLVQLTPRFAWLISSLASPAAQPALLAIQQGRCGNLPHDLLVTLSAVSEPCLRCTSWVQAISSAEELREWNAAADAALRLSPVAVDCWEQCSEQVRRQRQQGQGADVNRQPKPDLVAADLVNRCLGMWSQAVRMADEYVDQVLSAWAVARAAGVVVPDPGHTTQLAPLLWQLHGHSCRLVHYIVGSRSERQSLLRGGLVQGWAKLADRLSRAFYSGAGLLAALLDRDAAPGQGRWRWVEWKGTTSRDVCPESVSPCMCACRSMLRSLAAAHLAAVAALMPHLGSGVPEQFTLLNLRAACYVPSILLSHPPYQEMVLTLVRPLFQARLTCESSASEACPGISQLPMQESASFQTFIHLLLPLMGGDEAMGLTIILVRSSLIEQAFEAAGDDPRLSQARLSLHPHNLWLAA
jgi:hypothetical protein